MKQESLWAFLALVSLRAPVVAMKISEVVMVVIALKTSEVLVVVMVKYSLQSLHDSAAVPIPFGLSILTLGLFFQHDAMTCCQFLHGCCVPSM